MLPDPFICKPDKKNEYVNEYWMAFVAGLLAAQPCCHSSGDDPIISYQNITYLGSPAIL